MTDFIVVFITASTFDQAEKIGKALLEKKLVACVNIISDIKSIFWWQGEIDSSGEILLIAKSKKGLMSKIIRLIKSLHSYKIPEVIALPIVAGNKDYLKWINESC